MRRTGTVAILLVLAVLSAVIWLRLPSLTGPVWGYALVEAYCLVSGTPSTIMGIDGVTLAAIILSRPLMWLFIGYAVAVAVGCDRRAILVSLFVLAGLSIVCVVARQTAGPFLLGFTDVSLTGGPALTSLGGIVFSLPGLTCIVAHFIFER
ncbi:hypothetical protein [uncultured Parolsenella sp.]|uniref:hypothetical protein n=1 Tax=uncultured Parolsenella sp. TaxID=2083008 RepID=UPI0026580214|nr:hypothetical protein [uncultured Parolsenella sp.]